MSVVLVVLLFQARAPSQTLPGRVIRSVTTGEDPSRITAEQKKRVREKKLDEYKAQRKAQCDDQGKWTSFPVRDGCGDGNVCGTYDYADSQFDPTIEAERDIVLRTCEVEDEGGESGWVIYRIGPMVGIGGYDKHDVSIDRLPFPSKAKFITGKLMAPVYENGELAGFPPLHSHHIMSAFSGMTHAFESHGDTQCQDDFGGESCYLISYPKGYGLPYVNESVPYKDFLALNFLFNDVRRNDETVTPHPMVFYGETAFKWSAKVNEIKPASIAALHMRGSHAYVALIVAKEPNLRWGTGKWPVDGKVIISPEDQLPWFHAHRSYFTAFWAFAASPEELGLTTDLLEEVGDNNVTKNGDVDHKFDMVWKPKDPMKALEEKVAGSKAGLKSLRCWMVASNEEVVLEFVNETVPSTENSQPWQQNWKGSWYDRAGEVHCNPWSFKKGDSYTVVGMNGIDDRYNWTHDQSDFFTMMQHNILFLLYETTGPELGPTMEMFGGFQIEGQSRVVLKWSYIPDVLKDRVDVFFANQKGLKRFNKYIRQYFNQETGALFGLMRRDSPIPQEEEEEEEENPQKLNIEVHKILRRAL